MRPILVLLHRWFGLFAALFLLVSGLTGAVISWDHELDEWLNPHLFHARATGDPLPALELADRLEAADPRLRIRFMPLETEPGHTLGVMVEPRIDPASGQPFDLGFNQVAIDPADGEILGRREWGKVSLDRENLLPFLYKLHYSMHIPDIDLIPVGTLFMGIVAIVWVFDSLLALWISFPSRKSWRQSFAFRWQAGGYRLNFDLHRSGGVWLFLLVLMLAVTSVSMNLKEQVMRPVLGWVTELTPSPFATRAPVAVDQQKEPKMGRSEILAIARAEAERRGLDAPAGGIFHIAQFGIYGVGFFEAGNSHGDGGLGNPWLYFDADSGEALGGDIPGQGTAGDIFLQSMFPLHSGRIIGVPGRVLISLMGLAIAMFSVTGIVIWARKRKARLGRRTQSRELLADAGAGGQA
ncbi:MAG: PepSY domain-containing protein [Azonexus sp.]|nr:PepSY domain-containing protein [Azonexus sp.]